jgi:membrane dipeptidase
VIEPSQSPPLPFLDGHNDTLLALHAGKGGRSFFRHGRSGHLDLPRARAAGFAGGFFAVFVDSPVTEAWHEGLGKLMEQDSYILPMAPPVDPTYAARRARMLVERLFRVEAQSRGQLKVVRTAGELAGCIGSGTIGAILHFEGAEPIDARLRNLEEYYARGLRSVGLTWSRPNAFGHGVPFGYPHSPDTGPGLTPAGKEMVRACNRLGILVDCSHLNEQGFWDVARTSTAPLVATHSAAHAISPVTRNLTDRQLDAIRDSDGIVGLNFDVSFNRPDGRRVLDTPLEVMVRQIDYLVERLGIDRVGLGSDFDGANLSTELGDVRGVPKLFAALRARGCYGDDDLQKIAAQNWLRVLRLTWR